MKKNGFTLVEIMIVIAIGGILATVGIISFSGRGEKNASQEIYTRASMDISGILNRSFETGEERAFRINIENKSIEQITTTGTAVVLSQLVLPKIFTYTITGDIETDVWVSSGTTSRITVNGNGKVIFPWGIIDGDGMNIKVVDKNNNFVARIRIKNIPGIGIGIVELYKKDWNSTPIKI